MIGRVVGQYEIVDRLGSGGMGEVFKAKDRKLNRLVAMKVLPIHSRQDEERRQRFLQEARAASALNHPNIITVHDVVSDDAADYLVLELVNGKTLSELIPKGGLRSIEALRYAVQIAGALSAAHSAGILHRDLKPGNVMVNEHGMAKLLDFGLAKMIDGPLREDAANTETVAQGPRTTAGTILGTASYMSPEQIEGNPLDARSDVFSFGLVLYEMLTGERAFTGNSTITTLTAVLRDQPKSISGLASEVPPQFEQIVERCLQKDAAQRWQTMQDLHAALNGLKGDLETGRIAPSGRFQAVAAAAATNPSSPSRKMALYGGIGATAVFLFALGAAVVWMRSGPASRPPQLPPQQQSSQATEPAAQSADSVRPAAETPAPPLMPAVPTASPRPKPVERRIVISGLTPEPAQSAPQALQTSQPAPAPPQAAHSTVPQFLTLTIPDGSRLRMQLASDLPASAKPGDVVRLTVAEDLYVGGTPVVARGASVSAVLGEAGRRLIFGRSSKVPILLDVVRAVDGSSVKLRGSLKVQGGDKTRQIQIQPASGGKDTTPLLSTGTAVDAFIDGTSDVKVTRR